jgi:hypothetical protein
MLRPVLERLRGGWRQARYERDAAFIGWAGARAWANAERDAACLVHLAREARRAVRTRDPLSARVAMEHLRDLAEQAAARNADLPTELLPPQRRGIQAWLLDGLVNLPPL